MTLFGLGLVFGAPALPLHSAGKYVAGAYIVFLAVILIYVAIMARKLISNQRELAALKAELDRRERSGEGERSGERDDGVGWDDEFEESVR